MKNKEKRSFIANFFVGLASIIDAQGIGLQIVTGLIMVLAMAASILLLLGLPFYWIGGYITNDPVKRVVFTFPFLTLTFFFIAWIGSLRKEWNF